MVLAIVWRLVRSETLAAEAVQEATVAALVGLDRLRSLDRFSAWYAGIALNVARRWLRQPIASPLAGEQVDPGPGPEDQAEAAEVASRVREAVAGLPAGQRDAVLAFYWQGLTHAEAALELGIRPGAVKARLHQARTALNPQLAPWIQPEREETIVPAAANRSFVDARIVEVRRSAGDDPTRRPHVVVLEEAGGERRLPIYVGASEAIALACSLESVETPRPLTYQFSANLLAAAGAKPREVRITRLAEGTFYAEVTIDGPAGETQVDARPSDAVNLAVVADAPIRVDADLLNDTDATRHTAWQDFPTRAPDLAAEVRQRQEEQQAKLRDYLCTGQWGAPP
jgi:RNA polymerase sigma factor (sigma-70 family)